VSGASLVVSEQVYGTDFNFASARSTGVRDRPDLSYRCNTAASYSFYFRKHPLSVNEKLVLRGSIRVIRKSGKRHVVKKLRYCAEWASTHIRFPIPIPKFFRDLISARNFTVSPHMICLYFPKFALTPYLYAS
jgi:hypothetical protein